LRSSMIWCSREVSEVPETEVELWLFGKPEWELKDINTATPDEIRQLGEELRERLRRVAEIMKILEKNGWIRGGGGLYEIFYYKDIGIEEAKEELRRLGIDPEKEVDLFEEEEEE